MKGRKKTSLQLSDYAYNFCIFGQSNSMGQAQAQRLANSQFNYKGISSLYPAARNGQAQYVANPANLFLYYQSGLTQSSDFGGTSMSWVPYNATTNANYNLPVANQAFGLELSLGQQLLDRGLPEVFITKAGWGSTALVPGYGTTQPPGYWNNVSRGVADHFIYRRSIKDLATLRPGKRIKTLCNIWWQGENDGVNAVPKDVYKTNLAFVRKYIDSFQAATQVLDKPVPFFVIRIKHRLDATEEPIRLALAEYAAENANTYMIDMDPYPQKVQLTTDEAAPLTKGTPNTSGLNDDVHLSYIAMLAGGELIFNQLVQLGLV